MRTGGGFEGFEAELEEDGTVGEEECFFACLERKFVNLLLFARISGGMGEKRTLL